MKKYISTIYVLLISLGWGVNQAMAENNGFIVQKSQHSVEQTVAKIHGILEEKGLTIFTTVNHQKGAQSVGLEMAESQVIIFGNPKIGTQLMNCSSTIAIDLPLKFLVYEDENKEVMIGYYSMTSLKQRHNVEGCDEVVAKVDGVLANLSKAASQ